MAFVAAWVVIERRLRLDVFFFFLEVRGFEGADLDFVVVDELLVYVVDLVGGVVPRGGGDGFLVVIIMVYCC